MVTHETRVRRLALTGWILVVALLAYNCTRAAEVAPADTCHTGTIFVRGDGDEVVACVDGVLEPMLTLSESEDKARRAAHFVGGFALVIGFIFGWAVSAGRPTGRKR